MAMNVSQSATRPLLWPRLNQRTRWPAEPCWVVAYFVGEDVCVCKLTAGAELFGEDLEEGKVWIHFAIGGAVEAADGGLAIAATGGRRTAAVEDALRGWNIGDYKVRGAVG